MIDINYCKFGDNESSNDSERLKTSLIEKFESMKSDKAGSINTINIDYVIEIIRSTKY